MCQLTVRFPVILPTVTTIETNEPGIIREKEEHVTHLIIKVSGQPDRTLLVSNLAIAAEELTVPVGAFFTVIARVVIIESMVRKEFARREISRSSTDLPLGRQVVDETYNGKLFRLGVCKNHLLNTIGAELQEVNIPLKRKANAGDGGAAKIGSSSAADIDQLTIDIMKIRDYLIKALAKEFNDLIERFTNVLLQDDQSKIYQTDAEKRIFLENYRTCLPASVESYLNKVEAKNIPSMVSGINRPIESLEIRNLIPNFPDSFFSELFVDILCQMRAKYHLEVEEDICTDVGCDIAKNCKLEILEGEKVELTSSQRKIADYLKEALKEQFQGILKIFSDLFDLSGDEYLAFCNTQFEMQIHTAVSEIKESTVNYINSFRDICGDEFSMDNFLWILEVRGLDDFLLTLYGDTLDTISDQYECEEAEHEITKMVKQAIRSSSKE